MEKRLNIFIDHVWSENEVDGRFAKRIGDKIKTLNDVEVFVFGDSIGYVENWAELTNKAFEKADVIIPIVSPEYLNYAKDSVAQMLDKVSESRNKYFFPILYRPSEWSSHKWIVRSKIIPEDNKAITEHSEIESENIISSLVTIIKSITTKQNIEENITVTPANTNIVFISHDHEDADFAELLKLQLEKNGIIGWIDGERLKIGQDWREEIDISITNSLAVIAIMTPEARKSEYVTYEWAYAWGKGKKIFPLMLKQTQLHPRLESLQYLDFTKRSSRPYSSLIESIKELQK